jgi:glyoxylase-like metal-dependent hydrolase (beta-lactamase superfamily II)
MQRITLPNTFLEGQNNIYIFRGEETVLVDAGYDTEAIRERVRDGFAAEGTAVSELDRIYLTHYHIDHCGLLEWLVAESGASVYAHPDDVGLIEGDERSWEEYIQQRSQMIEEWSVPQEETDRLETALAEGEFYDREVSAVPINDGTEVDVGGTTMRAAHTPGHSLGHLAFVLPERNEILTGDALLPVYTPNVGGADIRVEQPLERYLNTLRRIAEGGYERAWPGHRGPIESPADRANEIIAHHEERAVKVLQVLADVETATPWEVSMRIFGNLEGIHVLHGPGEAYAHLEHLTRTGPVEQNEGRFRLPAQAATKLSQLEGDRWSLGV